MDRCRSLNSGLGCQARIDCPAAPTVLSAVGVNDGEDCEEGVENWEVTTLPILQPPAFLAALWHVTPTAEH